MTKLPPLDVPAFLLQGSDDGVDPNLADHAGFTPLHMAAQAIGHFHTRQIHDQPDVSDPEAFKQFRVAAQSHLDLGRINCYGARVRRGHGNRHG